ncbi:tyrosinase family oxidase copper chaperone [Streptomyces sp. NPDC056716]|uniref:tyrosinase family oxidase copper chaperone n=1 Tax=unclassified Streptomyces TaxID=2593676 RepID=UPI00369EF3AA
MVVRVGGTGEGAGQGAVARPGRWWRGRRALMRGLLGSAAALAVAPLVAASRPARQTEPPPDLAFDEIHRGRRIRGARTSATAATTALAAERWDVTVDGRPLPLMRRADGGWLSMVDHYRSYSTPLDAARAAVDALGPGEQLRETATAHGGGHHGVHA